MRPPSNQSVESGLPDEDLVEVATTWFVRMRSEPVSDQDRRGFEAWLDRDPTHGVAYAEAEALWGEIGEMPDPRGETGGTPRIANDPVRRDSGRRRRISGIGRALAASIVLAAALGFWSTDAYDTLRADHVTAVGEVRTIALADGSVVQLNTDTAIGIDFSAGHRRVDLYRGEAFFTVAKDESRPFDVVAGNGVSRAVGTAFDVHDAKGMVTVALEEGLVRVSRAVAPAPNAAGILLRAGETIRYGRSGEIDAPGKGDPAALAWRQGKLVFADRPLREVVAEIGRYRAGTIVILAPLLADARFTGVVNLRDTDQALAAIQGSLGIDVVRITPYLTLLRARS